MSQSSSPQRLRLVKQEAAPRASSDSGEFCVHTQNVATPRKPARAEGAAILSQALRITMETIGASVTDVAFWCDTDRRTVQRWLNGDATVASECIVCSSRLWATFDREVNRLRAELGIKRKVSL